MGDGPARMPGARVVADEQGDVEPAVRSRALDHRPRLLALQDARGRVDPIGSRLNIPPWLSLTRMSVGAGGQGALDRGVGLADHQVDGGRIAGVAGAVGSGWLTPAIPSMSTLR